MRLRFTIRDLLWLTLVAALGVCLWIARASALRDRELRQSAEKESAALQAQLAVIEARMGALLQQGKRYQTQINDLEQRLKDLKQIGGPFRLAPTIVTEKPDDSAAGK